MDAEENGLGIIRSFDPDRVKPLPNQPRKRFAGINELAQSISEVGQVSPGLVTPLAGDDRFDAQLVDGERRLRACKIAGVKFRAEVRSDASAEKIFKLSFASNFGKQDHDPIEIALGLQRLRDAGDSVQECARTSGHSMIWVYQYLNLLRLHPAVQAMMMAQEDEQEPALSLSAGTELVSLPESSQITLAAKIVAAGGLSTRNIRRLKMQEMDRKKIERPKSPPPKSLKAIENLLEDFTFSIARYLDMPGPELNALIDSMRVSARRNLCKTIDDVAEGLSGLAEAIEARLLKVQSRRSD
jgi:ParB family chromosome partitioning protein